VKIRKTIEAPTPMPILARTGRDSRVTSVIKEFEFVGVGVEEAIAAVITWPDLGCPFNVGVKLLLLVPRVEFKVVVSLKG
jgi:hypothetical protein